MAKPGIVITYRPFARLFTPSHTGLVAQVTAGEGHGAMARTVAKGATGVAGVIVVKAGGTARAFAGFGGVEAKHRKIVSINFMGRAANQ